MYSVTGRQVLITGASGFIGSHLTRHLLARGDSVRCLFDTGDLPEALRRAEVIRADLRDKASVMGAVQGVDVVFHLGGVASVADAAASPDQACLVNTTGTLNVVEGARIATSCRVVILSTAHVFGQPRNLPVTEGHPFAPASVYAASKLAADVIALGYAANFGVPVTILRTFNVYGPGQKPVAVIPSIIDQVLRTGSAQVRDSRPKRDFVFIDDVTDALVMAADSPLAGGQQFLLASGIATSIGDVLRRVLLLADRPSTTQIPVHDSDSEDCIYGSAVRAHQLLGWKPSTELDAGLAKTIAWRRSHLNSQT